MCVAGTCGWARQLVVAPGIGIGSGRRGDDCDLGDER